MTNGVLSDLEFVRDGGNSKGVDDLKNGMLNHDGGTMTINLSFVKTSDPAFHQENCHAIFAAMADREKPYGDIAYRLRWHRELMKLTQNEYAKKVGVKRAALNNWESGDYRLSLDGALALRKTFGLSLDFMYAGNDDALPLTLRNAWRDNLEVNASN
ncbi:helix-turn-helix domain-containing protein [Salipiger pacificus]|nr:helix-turn-helix domain-containing protein [Alloyangia pacifica]